MVIIGFACADRQNIVHFVMVLTKSHTFKRKLCDFFRSSLPIPHPPSTPFGTDYCTENYLVGFQIETKKQYK